jgi:hypothetical protein
MTTIETITSTASTGLIARMEAVAKVVDKVTEAHTRDMEVHIVEVENHTREAVTRIEEAEVITEEISDSEETREEEASNKRSVMYAASLDAGQRNILSTNESKRTIDFASKHHIR